MAQPVLLVDIQRVFQAGNFEVARSFAVLLAEEVRQCYSRKNADNHDHDHQLHQGEALLKRVLTLLAVEQRQLQTVV